MVPMLHAGHSCRCSLGTLLTRSLCSDWLSNAPFPLFIYPFIPHLLILSLICQQSIRWAPATVQRQWEYRNAKAWLLVFCMVGGTGAWLEHPKYCMSTAYERYVYNKCGDRVGSGYLYLEGGGCVQGNSPEEICLQNQVPRRRSLWRADSQQRVVDSPGCVTSRPLWGPLPCWKLLRLILGVSSEWNYKPKTYSDLLFLVLTCNLL